MASEFPIPIICGPTGSGKSAVASKIAAAYSVEIVSADSRQIIKYLEIGTAKPTTQQRSICPIHMLDLIDPGERYSAFQYAKDARQAINDILSRDRLPVIVGGTGLYLRALTDGVIEIDNSDPVIRERLEREMDKVGSEVMHDRLKQLDPHQAEQIHPNNKVRVIRAIEICELAGMSKTDLIKQGNSTGSDLQFEYHCINPPRDQLYGAINERVDLMMRSGLLAEVEKLTKNGLKQRLRLSNVIGYEELLDHLEGKLSLDQAVAMIKQNSRRYAKRQVTWFKKQPGCQYYSYPEQLFNVLAKSEQYQSTDGEKS